MAFHIVRELVPGDWLASGLKGCPGQMGAHLVQSRERSRSLAGHRSCSMRLWDLPVSSHHPGSHTFQNTTAEACSEWWDHHWMRHSDQMSVALCVPTGPNEKCKSQLSRTFSLPGAACPLCAHGLYAGRSLLTPVKDTVGARELGTYPAPSNLGLLFPLRPTPAPSLALRQP